MSDEIKELSDSDKVACKKVFDSISEFLRDKPALSERTYVFSTTKERSCSLQMIKDLNHTVTLSFTKDCNWNSVIWLNLNTSNDTIEIVVEYVDSIHYDVLSEILKDTYVNLYSDKNCTKFLEYMATVNKYINIYGMQPGSKVDTRHLFNYCKHHNLAIQTKDLTIVTEYNNYEWIFDFLKTIKGLVNLTCTLRYTHKTTQESLDEARIKLQDGLIEILDSSIHKCLVCTSNQVELQKYDITDKLRSKLGET